MVRIASVTDVLNASDLRDNDRMPIGRSGTPRARVSTIAALHERGQNIFDNRYLRQTNLSVTTAHIANRAVTGAKIAQNTIATNNIQDNAITAAKLSDDITLGGGGGGDLTQSVADQRYIRNIADSVSSTNLAANAVITEKILNQAVTGAKIADNTITLSKLATDARPSSGGGAAFVITSLPQGSIAAADQFAFADVSDSNNQKRTTIQAISNFIFEDSRFTSLSSGGDDGIEVDRYLFSNKDLNARTGQTESATTPEVGAMTLPTLTAATGTYAPSNSELMTYTATDETATPNATRSGNRIRITEAGTYAGAGVVRVFRSADTYNGNNRSGFKTYMIINKGTQSLLSSPVGAYIRGAASRATTGNAVITRLAGGGEVFGTYNMPPIDLAVGDTIEFRFEVMVETEQGNDTHAITRYVGTENFIHNNFDLIREAGTASSGGGVGGAADQALLSSYVDLPTTANQSINATLSNPITISAGGHLEIDLINNTTQHTFSIPVRKVVALNGRSDALNSRSTNTLELALGQDGSHKWAFAASGFNVDGITNININFSSSTGSTTTFDTITGFTTSATNLPGATTWRINEVHLVA